MKISVVSPDAHGRIDGTVQANLLNHLPNLVPISQSDVVVVPVSWYSDYAWRHDLTGIIGSKPYVILDYVELGLEWDLWSDLDSMVIGRNVLNFPRVSGKDWVSLNDFVRDRPPVCYFKRELLNREITDWLRPADFPCPLPLPAIQTKQEFDSRPLDVFWFWGLSHPARPRLHGEIFSNAYDHGYEVMSQFGHWEGFFSCERGTTWASIHAPHFDRKPISDVMHFNHRSKISVSLPGAGYHCFRDTEAPVGAIPAFWHMPIARAFPWIHGRNCIELRPSEEWRDLYESTKRDDLYEIYVSAQANIANYTCGNYVNNHVIPSIERML
jgi:hypothetical protein